MLALISSKAGLWLTCLCLTAVPMSKQTEFIERVAPLAVMAQVATGIPASVTIAQAILETGWGSSVPEGSSNYFGIKSGKNWKGETITFVTHEEHADGVWRPQTDTFRKYSSDEEAFLDHGALFYNGMYEAALPYRSQAYEFLKRIAPIYATDSQYEVKLASIMRKYNLTKYDVPVEQWLLDPELVPPKWAKWAKVKGQDLKKPHPEPAEAGGTGEAEPVASTQTPPLAEASNGSVFHALLIAVVAIVLALLGWAQAGTTASALAGESILWVIIIIVLGAALGKAINPLKYMEEERKAPGEQLNVPGRKAPRF